MNHHYRTVVNQAGLTQAVGENAKGHGKSGFSNASKAAAALFLTLPFSVFAADLPTGGSIASGSGQITTPNAAQMQVQQNSNKLIVNWQSFNIGENSSVTFNQPSSAAIALNRVLGSDGSQILGKLDANGKVFLVNPNGVLFGKTAQVNTAGLVASTLNISDDNFLNGHYRFEGQGGEVVNQGNIAVTDGGSVALLGGRVLNDGVIVARLGNVALAAGKAITLDFAGDGLLSVEINEGLKDALVKNGQLIVADGGQVILSAKAAETLVENLVNNKGIIQARTIGEHEGKIVLLGEGGTTQVAGTLDASAPEGGNGGFIETSGDTVKIADDVKITTYAENGKTGTWLIDPEYFIIGAGGTAGATITAQLENTDVTAEASKDVIVNDAINWSKNTLTLDAGQNVLVNNVLTATENAGLVAKHGTGTDADNVPYGLYVAQGGSGAFAGKIDLEKTVSVSINDKTYTVLTNDGAVAITNFINGDGTGYYVLGSDIATGFQNQQIANFSGNLNGLGHIITYGNTAAYDWIGGLFNELQSSATVSNLGLGGTPITANGKAAKSVGALANTNNGNILNSFSTNVIGSTTGNVTMRFLAEDGESHIGGLVGTNESGGLIAQSYYQGSVAGTIDAGGLVGLNEGRIIDSSARAATSGHNVFAYASDAVNDFVNGYFGGFVGINQGSIERSWTNNFVSTSPAIIPSIDVTAGGFVGLNDTDATIEESYAYRDSTVATTATAPLINKIGGFVGENRGSIDNTYAYNTLYGSSVNRVAGFVYLNTATGTISNSYAQYGALTSRPLVSSGVYGDRYGFVNTNEAEDDAFSNVYWGYLSGIEANAPLNTDANGSSNENITAVGVGLTGSLSNYKDFDSDIWTSANSGFPMLKALAKVYVSNGTAAFTYGAATPLTTTNVLNVIGLQAGDTKASTFGIDSAYLLAQGLYLNAGSYLAADVMLPKTSNASIYDLHGSFTVAKKALTAPVLGVAIEDKVYDGETTATTKPNLINGGFTGLIGSDTLNVSYDAEFVNKNAGVSNAYPTLAYLKPVLLSNVEVADGDGMASNYSWNDTYTVNARITPLALDASAFNVEASNQTYDGNLIVKAFEVTTSNNVLQKDIEENKTVALQPSTAAFADANAGEDKDVTLDFALDGTGKSNYTWPTTLTTTASITPRPISVVGITDNADTLALDNLVLQTLLGTDDVGLTGTLALTGNQLDLTQLALTGAQAGNYVLTDSYVAIGDFERSVMNATANVGFDTETNPTEITLGTDQARIDWSSFGIASDETVSFNFTNGHAGGVVLNRVLGGKASLIAGTLNSNGRVYILNAAGVLFAPTSTVNVAALLASTHTLSEDDFEQNKYLFVVAQGDGHVLNMGDIVVDEGGFIALASVNGVSNTGVLTAPGGEVLLAAAGELELSGQGDLSAYTVASLSGAVESSGTIDVAKNDADGRIALAGQSLEVDESALETGSSGALALTLPTLTVNDGAGGIANASATLGAAFVNAQLAKRNLALNTVGDLAVDQDIAWASDNTLVLDAAQIDINARLTASGVNAGLTLSDDYSINNAGYDAWNQQATGSDGAGVTLSGANARLSIGGQDYTLLHDMADFAQINDATGFGYYALAENVDASGTSYDKAVITSLSGTLAGLGNTIDKLTIDAGKTDNVGLIGTAEAGSVIRDLDIRNAEITGSSYVGILAGRAYGSIQNVHVEGQVIGYEEYGTLGYLPEDAVQGGGHIGGLAGHLEGTLKDASAEVEITGTINGGGLTSVGGLVGTVNQADIENVNSSGEITGGYGIGGLIGALTDSSINGAGADVAVQAQFQYGVDVGYNAPQYTGGLIGVAQKSPSAAESYLLSNVWASGKVSGGSEVGGLIGSNGYNGGKGIDIDGAWASGEVNNFTPQPGTCYISGNVGGLVGINYANVSNATASGNVITLDEGGANPISNVGGLIGQNRLDSTISNSSYTGDLVQGYGYVGGLVGNNGGTITNSTVGANTTVSGGLNVGGLVGQNLGRVENSTAYASVDSTLAGGGGLVGANSNSGVIDNSAAYGDVNGRYTVGGLVGANAGAISNSQAAGNVTANGLYGTGGLAGSNNSTGSITNSSSSGNVQGLGNETGALVGINGGSISNSTATGALDNGGNGGGGLVGTNSVGGSTGTVDNASTWTADPNPPAGDPGNGDPGNGNTGNGDNTSGDNNPGDNGLADGSGGGDNTPGDNDLAEGPGNGGNLPGDNGLADGSGGGDNTPGDNDLAEGPGNGGNLPGDNGLADGSGGGDNIPGDNNPAEGPGNGGNLPGDNDLADGSGNGNGNGDTPAATLPAPYQPVAVADAANAAIASASQSSLSALGSVSAAGNDNASRRLLNARANPVNFNADIEGLEVDDANFNLKACDKAKEVCGE